MEEVLLSEPLYWFGLQPLGKWHMSVTVKVLL